MCASANHPRLPAWRSVMRPLTLSNDGDRHSSSSNPVLDNRSPLEPSLPYMLSFFQTRRWTAQRAGLTGNST